MAKLLAEARSICPELTDAIKIIDDLARTRHYDEVFSDLINWLVWQYEFPPQSVDPVSSKYNQKEREAFLEMFKNIQAEVRSRVALWIKEKNPKSAGGDWYDPLGRLYECITSKYKSSKLAQFFTPEAVVDMMTKMTIPNETQGVQRILDPTCGSGRMGLAAASNCLQRGIPSWITMNDIDPICTKMTAVNMAMHGLVGEATCMNGLDLGGESYRFGYQVIPALAKFPQENLEYYRMLIMMKTGQDIKKQYLLIPIAYEQTFLKQANDQVLEELEQRKKVKDEAEREAAVQEIKDKVKNRLSGTLFAGDKSQLDNIVLPSEQRKKTPKKSKPNQEDEQGRLF